MPTPYSQKLGEYTLIVARAIGIGTSGRVRPATGPLRDTLVAIKIMEFKRITRISGTDFISKRIGIMEELT